MNSTNTTGYNWLTASINVLILFLFGIIMFITFSKGAVLEFTLLGSHFKIYMYRLANPVAIFVFLTVLRFYLWWLRSRPVRLVPGKNESIERRMESANQNGGVATNIPVRSETLFNKKNLLIFLIVILITIITCNWLYTTYLTHTSKMPASDMGAHGLCGVKIANDISNLDLKSFIVDTNDQKSWPFVHSYLLAAYFLFLGNSVNAATLLSISASALVVIFIFLTSVSLSEKDGWFAGLCACFMAITSKYYLVFSTLIMLEIFGALFTLLSLLLYVKSVETGSRTYYFSTSIAVTTLFLTKYNYGILVLISIVFMEYVRLPDRTRLNDILSSFAKEILFKKSPAINLPTGPVFPARIYFLFVPALLIIFIWLAYPYPHKLNGFLNFVTKKNYLSNMPVLPFISLGNFLFYPKIINNYYFLSPSVFYVSAFLFVSSFFGTNDIRIKIFRNFFLIGFILAMLHPLKETRSMFTLMPAYWIVAAYQAHKLISKVIQNISSKSAVTAKMLFILLIGSISYPSVKALTADFPTVLSAYYGDRQLTDVLNYMSDNLDTRSKVLFIGAFNELNTFLIQWDLSEKRRFLPDNIAIDDLDFGKKRPGTFDASAIPDIMMNGFRKLMEKSEYGYIVTINVMDNSKYFVEDYKIWHIWKKNYIHLMEHNQSNYHLIAERFFSNVGLNVKIYRIGESRQGVSAM